MRADISSSCCQFQGQYFDVKYFGVFNFFLTFSFTKASRELTEWRFKEATSFIFFLHQAEYDWFPFATEVSR